MSMAGESQNRKGWGEAGGEVDGGIKVTERCDWRSYEVVVG